ncbi:MAG: SsrA-binding protein SmpB [Spirochaetes bacterium]|nr:SsrA-binding protein SmpB [Spirochaetota bacterium]HNV43397.1 SsrA-binding protein SmpB [Exilispira sp.]MBP8991481.1 SsrA-binding protein SmpB [Spirochaetota bacterium]HOV46841.1 SsrA-binding protein SmpB [Exilispira sp.]HPO61073.1 SsrA-binding protein SmpB [Exilispira sp.]
MSDDNIKIILKNKKAFFEYFIEQKFEAGIVLKGTEIKSIREGHCSIQDSYARITKNFEIYLIGFVINEYKNSGYVSHEPNRPKKLLLHKNEILRISKKVNQAGYTLIPLSVYIKGAFVKVELGLAKGKKLYDKRESIKKKELDRQMNRKEKY